MKKYLDVEHLVFDCILSNFKTRKVEQNLSEDARLLEDLSLSVEEIKYLGLAIEKELQLLSYKSFTDAQITNWETVNDIMISVLESIH